MNNPMRKVIFATLLIGTILVAQAAHAAPAPDFTLPLLDGKSIALKDFRGKPVLLNFFHSK